MPDMTHVVKIYSKCSAFPQQHDCLSEMEQLNEYRSNQYKSTV